MHLAVFGQDIFKAGLSERLEKEGKAMKKLRIYVDGEETCYSYTADTESEAIESYKNDCIADYLENPDPETFEEFDIVAKEE